MKTRAMRQRSLPQRLVDYRKIDENGCWIWTGALDDAGYGTTVLHYHSKTSKQLRVHRVSYILHYGAIPKGYTLDHLCREKKCFNPTHLEAVTSRENNERNKKKYCQRGHLLSRNSVAFAKNHGRYCRICNQMRGKGIATPVPKSESPYVFDGKARIKEMFPKRVDVSSFSSTDVTPEIVYGKQAEHTVCLIKCICGAEFSEWGFLLSEETENYCKCPSCNRMFYFQRMVRVYELRE